MSWKPTTDFEEEIVNLNPEHDFIFAALSEQEPQPFYPRPQSHIEYAATKKQQTKKQQEEFETTGRFNDRLRVIAEVQRIAGTKPLGEQPALSDWDTDKDVETEVVAMMRHFGMGPSVEEPLNENVTIATYPVQNGVNVMKNGQKKVPLLFNNNLFKLKPKVSNTSSSASASKSTNDSDNSCNNSLDKEDESFSDNSSLGSYNKARADRQTMLLQAERMQQYNKLMEDTTTTDDEITFSTASNNQESFKTARNRNTRSTSSLQLNDSYLSSHSSDYMPSNNSNSSESYCSLYDGEHPNSLDNTRESGETSAFLQRFIVSDENETKVSKSSSSSNSASSSSSSKLPLTYANVTKRLVKPPEPLSAGNTAANVFTLSTRSSQQTPKLRFYSAREIYAMKRSKANNHE